MKTIWVIATTALWWVTVQNDASTAVLEPTSPLQGNPKETLHSEGEPLKPTRERRQGEATVDEINETFVNGQKICPVLSNVTGFSIECANAEGEFPMYMISGTADSADGFFRYVLFPDGTGFSTIYESQQFDVTFTETALEGEIKFPIDHVHMQDGVYTLNSKILELEVKPSATFPIDEADCNRHLFLVRSGEQVIRVKTNRNLGRDPPRGYRYKRGNDAQGRRLTEEDPGHYPRQGSDYND